MLLKRPKEFERVAREWAVVYAGAPATNAAGGTDYAEDARASIVNDLAQ